MSVAATYPSPLRPTLGQHEESMSATMSHPNRQSRPIKRLVFAALSAAAFAIGLATPPHAQDGAGQDQRPALMALVDGSGSMWGGLGSGGKSKLAATREALESILPQAAQTHRLGLATFGPGCRAASVAVAPTDSNVDAVTVPLVKFNPRGKGPLSAGLKAAADIIGGTNGGDGGGTIVLFHDGLDNCGEDSCAAAAELHATKPDITIHTISLGMEAAEVAAISCVAKATGGRAYTASDPDDVVRALTDIASLIDKAAPTPPPPVAETAPAASPAEKGPSRLVASARLIAGGSVVSMPLTWRVMSADGRKVLHEAVAPSFAVPLPGGGVRVEVTSGRIAITRDIEIAKEGDTVLDVALDAGIVRFDTGAKRLASDAEEPLIFLEKLSTQRTGTDVRDGGRTSTPLWIARGKAIEAMLPPGDYRAVAEYGLARAVAPVRVAAGQALNLSLPLEAGRLELATVPQGGDDVVYRVEVDDPDRAGGRRELTRTAHAAPVFVLSTGTYYVTATTGGDEVRRLVTVRSGEVTRETFNLDLVSLEVDATINGAAEPRAPLTLGIKRLDETSIAQTASERLVSLGRAVRLVPGTYRITVRHGLNDVVATRNIRIAKGDTQRVRIDLKTAEVSLDIIDADGSPFGAVCEMKTDRGEVIWRTVEVRPVRVVAPGQYALRCRAGATVRDVAVTAAAGQVTRVAPFSR